MVEVGVGFEVSPNITSMWIVRQSGLAMVVSPGPNDSMTYGCSGQDQDVMNVSAELIDLVAWRRIILLMI